MRNCPTCDGSGTVMVKCWTSHPDVFEEPMRDFRDELCQTCDGHGHHPADWTGCDQCVEEEAARAAALADTRFRPGPRPRLVQ